MTGTDTVERPFTREELDEFKRRLDETKSLTQRAPPGTRHPETATG